jgi:hypothetical protein
MANLNLKVTIPASGKVQISTFLPTRSGGTGNLLASSTASPFSDSGSIFAQQLLFQNQGTHNMWIGDATTTNTNGLILFATGSANFGAFIDYGTYLSDWWVVGTPGDVLFLLYIQ